MLILLLVVEAPAQWRRFMKETTWRMERTLADEYHQMSLGRFIACIRFGRMTPTCDDPAMT
jgi:hypothetical protein